MPVLAALGSTVTPEEAIPSRNEEKSSSVFSAAVPPTRTNSASWIGYLDRSGSPEAPLYRRVGRIGAQGYRSA
jgi:hypothetical protein